MHARILTASLVTAFTCSVASAQTWIEDFESYAVNSGLEGQGPWQNQNGVTTTLTTVSDAQALSGTQCAQVHAGASTVAPVATVTSGTWSLSVQVYLPSGSAAGVHVRALSTFVQSGTMNPGSWIMIDGNNDEVLCFAGQPAPFFLTPPRDRWFDVRTIVDLDNDTAEVYFDDQLVNTMTWTSGYNGMIGEPAPQLEAVHFFGVSGPGEAYVDDVRLEPFVGTVGTTYCSPAAVNSSGGPASIRAVGSRSAAANDLTLQAAGVPAGQFGMFVTSQVQGAVPVGNGTLCLGGSIGRYTLPAQIQQASAAGEFELALDLTATPQGLGVVGIVSGETWNFQAWFRDTAAGGAASNFTDAVQIDFN